MKKTTTTTYNLTMEDVNTAIRDFLLNNTDYKPGKMTRYKHDITTDDGPGQWKYDGATVSVTE